MDKKTSSTVAELIVASKLVENGFRIYLPHQANNKDDDLIAVNIETDNIFRIQVKSKKDTKKTWSARFFFRNIQKKANKTWIFILYEHPTGKTYIVPSNDLAKQKSNTKGFSDENEKYLDRWDLLK